MSPIVLIPSTPTSYNLSNARQDRSGAYWIVRSSIQQETTTNLSRKTNKRPKSKSQSPRTPSRSPTAKSFGFFSGAKRVRTRGRKVVDWDDLMDELEAEQEQTEAIKDGDRIRRTAPRRSSSSPATMEHGTEPTEGHISNRVLERSEHKVRSKGAQPRMLKRCSFWLVPGVGPPKRAKRGRK